MHITTPERKHSIYSPIGPSSPKSTTYNFSPTKESSYSAETLTRTSTSFIETSSSRATTDQKITTLFDIARNYLAWKAENFSPSSPVTQSFTSLLSEDVRKLNSIESERANLLSESRANGNDKSAATLEVLGRKLRPYTQSLITTNTSQISFAKLAKPDQESVTREVETRLKPKKPFEDTEISQADKRIVNQYISAFLQDQIRAEQTTGKSSLPTLKKVS